MSQRKKLNQEILSTRFDDKVGKIIRGTFIGVTPMMTQAGEPVLGKFGQHLHTFELCDFEGKTKGEVKKYWCDAGLRGGFKMAKVEQGMNIEIEHTGKKEIDEGTVQTYDIFLV